MGSRWGHPTFEGVELGDRSPGASRRAAAIPQGPHGPRRSAPPGLQAPLWAARLKMRDDAISSRVGSIPSCVPLIAMVAMGVPPAIALRAY